MTKDKRDDSARLLPGSVLLTGATGFLGRRLLHRLTVGGTQGTLCYAVIRPGHGGDLPAVLCPWDLSGPIPPRALPNQVDALVHLAADRQRSSASIGSLPRQIRIHVDATARLFDWARRSDVKRIVHLSTASVFQAGPLEAMALDDHSPLVGAPAHPYALTKRWSEEIVLAMRKHVESIHILRPTQVYGPGQGGEGALAKIALRLWQGKKFRLPMPDGDRLNPVFIDDVLDMIIRLLGTPGHETLTIGGQDIIGERLIIEDIGRRLGMTARIEADSKAKPRTRAFSPAALDARFPERCRTPWSVGAASTNWDALLR